MVGSKYIIYKTTNTVNGKIYVGQHITKNINDSYFGSGVVFRKAVKKYGKSNFTKEILCVSIPCKHHLNYLEKKYIKMYNSKSPAGYNLTEGGEGASGMVLSEETKLKISLNHANVAGANNPRYGITLPQYIKDKISLANKGNKRSLGRVVTDHQKAAQSKIMTGRHLTEAHKLAISEGGKGRIMSLDLKNKLREVNIGSKRSDETKLKQSTVNKNRPYRVCPHCGLSSKGYSGLKRFHYDKCLLNPNLSKEDILVLINLRKPNIVNTSQTEETRHKISIAMKSRTAHNKGKKFKNNKYE